MNLARSALIATALAAVLASAACGGTTATFSTKDLAPLVDALARDPATIKIDAVFSPAGGTIKFERTNPTPAPQPK